MDEAKGLNPYFEGLHQGESDELRTLRLALVKERDRLHSSIECEKRWRKDAEENAGRYIWLRDRAYFDGDEGAATAWCVYGTCAGDAIPTHSEDLDAAIDARMAAVPAVGAA